MKRTRKWGIFWLVMLAWNGESLGYHLGSDQWWRAGLDLLIVIWVGIMAYSELTKHSDARLTVTIQRPEL